MLTRELSGTKRAGGFVSMVSLCFIDKSVILFPSPKWTVQSIQKTNSGYFLHIVTQPQHGHRDALYVKCLIIKYPKLNLSTDSSGKKS